MQELDFDIDVVDITTQTRPLLAAALCGALAASGALFTFPARDTAPRPPPQPTATAAPATEAAPIASLGAPPSEGLPSEPDGEPTMQQEPAPAAPLSPRIARQRARALAERGELMRVLAKTVATAPEVKAKLAPRAPSSSTLQSASLPAGRALDSADVDVVMRDRALAFQSCYERALKRSGSLRASLDVTFTIGAQGNVRGAKVVARDKHPHAAGLARCVRGVVERVLFGPTGGAPLLVSRTLTFRPQG